MTEPDFENNPKMYVDNFTKKITGFLKEIRTSLNEPLTPESRNKLINKLAEYKSYLDSQEALVSKKVKAHFITMLLQTQKDNYASLEKEVNKKITKHFLPKPIRSAAKHLGRMLGHTSFFKGSSNKEKVTKDSSHKNRPSR